MIELFPDQADLIERTRKSMRKNKRLVVMAATGAGKTIISGSMIASSRNKGNRSMFVVPRKELLKQTAKKFFEFGIPFSYVASGYNYNPYQTTLIASAQTLVNRIYSVPVPDVVFIDEAHWGGDQIDKITQYYAAKNIWVIGLTATPKEGMDKVYQDMICGESVDWLIKNKRLSEYRPFSPSLLDLSAVKTVAGEYHQGQLSDKMEHDKVLIGDAVKHYQKNAMGRLNLAYCTSIKHSEITAQMFRDAGIPAMSVSGKTSDDEMTRIVKAYARREILVLCNCDLLTFGFDLESASGGMKVTVESMSDLGPTKSITKQSQKWGRVLRIKDFPALLFDHAGNMMHANGTLHHGFPCSDRDWSIKSREKSQKEAVERTLAVKKCLGGFKNQNLIGEKMPACHFTHLPAPRCPGCGAWYEVASRMVEELDGELHELTKADRELLKQEKTKYRKAEEKSAAKKGLDALIELGVSRNYEFPEQWAAKQISLRNAYRRK